MSVPMVKALPCLPVRPFAKATALHETVIAAASARRRARRWPDRRRWLPPWPHGLDGPKDHGGGARPIRYRKGGCTAHDLRRRKETGSLKVRPRGGRLRGKTTARGDGKMSSKIPGAERNAPSLRPNRAQDQPAESRGAAFLPDRPRSVSDPRTPSKVRH